MFKVTVNAAEKIKQAAQESGADGMALRFAAEQRPDGAIDYRMGFDQSGEEDITFSSEGIAIVMAPEYVPLLDEATMDYVQLEDGEYQFIFLNPKDSNYQPPQENA